MTKIRRRTVFLIQLAALAWLCVGALAHSTANQVNLVFYQLFPTDQGPRFYTANSSSQGLKWRQDSSYGASLALPPKGNQDLCNSTWDAPDGVDLFEPVAILTQQGGCSMDEKIESLLAGIEQIPLQSRHKITFVILYGDLPSVGLLNSLNVTTSPHPEEANYTDADLSTIGFLTIDQCTGEDIIRQEILPKEESGEGSPYLLDPPNNKWFLPVRMEPIKDESDDDNRHEVDPTVSLTLFCIMFCFVFCIPAMMRLGLWYTDGGRIDFTRHGQRVHILQPGLLTKREVLALPEIAYRQVLSKSYTPNLQPELTTDEERPNLSTLDVDATDESFTTSCTMCSICIQDFEDNEMIRLLPKCKHGFHTECIMPWLTTRKPLCPLCNTDVHSSDNDGASGSDDQTDVEVSSGISV